MSARDTAAQLQRMVDELEHQLDLEARRACDLEDKLNDALTLPERLERIIDDLEDYLTAERARVTALELELADTRCALEIARAERLEVAS